MNTESENAKFRAGVIGLGKVGNLFDADPLREGVWTHAGAYEASERATLICGCDPDAASRDRFAEMRPGAKPYADLREMLAAERLDAVSVCTHPAMHREHALAAAGAGARAIFCEKPLALTLEDARDIVRACREKEIALAVNHVRRWDPVYMVAARAAKEGEIGRPLSLRGVYADNVFNLGSHLIDAMRMLAGNLVWAQGEATQGGDAADPPVTGLLGFESGAVGSIDSTGRHDDLIFELEAVGEEGRIRIVDNGAAAEFWRFEKSGRYQGYRELVLKRTEKRREWRPFCDAVDNLLGALAGGEPLRCKGEDGFHAIAASAALLESARRGGERVAVERL